jgi:hypothetical protein
MKAPDRLNEHIIRSADGRFARSAESASLGQLSPPVRNAPRP